MDIKIFIDIVFNFQRDQKKKFKKIKTSMQVKYCNRNKSV